MDYLIEFLDTGQSFVLADDSVKRYTADLEARGNSFAIPDSPTPPKTQTSGLRWTLNPPMIPAASVRLEDISEVWAIVVAYFAVA